MCSTLSFCMVVVLLSAPITGKVIVKSKNSSQSVEFIDIAANFGPSMPAEGILGYLYNVNPPNACQPVEPPPDNSSFWIALIIRDNCNFVDKVKNVQQWSMAAIVYNHADDNTVTPMSGDGSDINIPSVFIGHADGRELAKRYCFNCTDPDKGAYQILLKEPSYTSLMLWPFAVVVGGCFILLIIFIKGDPLRNGSSKWIYRLSATFFIIALSKPLLQAFFMYLKLVKVVRDIKRKKKSKLSKKHLKKIPVKKFKKGDSYDVCAVCIEEYKEGDKLRILPCSHVYHAKCVDPWLTQSKCSCPICKQRVIPRDEMESNSEDSDDDDESPSVSERTPLLNSTSRAPQSSSLAFEHSTVPAETGETQQDSSNNKLHNSTQSDEPGSENDPVSETKSATFMTEPMVAAIAFVPKYESTMQCNISSKENTQFPNNVPNMPANEKEDIAVNIGAEEDNPNFVVDERCVNDGAAFLHCANDIVFKEPGRKDEKKHSRVI